MAYHKTWLLVNHHTSSSSSDFTNRRHHRRRKLIRNKHLLTSSALITFPSLSSATPVREPRNRIVQSSLRTPLSSPISSVQKKSSFVRSTNQPINQSMDQPINRSTNQLINQSTNQPINLSTNQSIPCRALRRPQLSMAASDEPSPKRPRIGNLYPFNLPSEAWRIARSAQLRLDFDQSHMVPRRDLRFFASFRADDPPQRWMQIADDGNSLFRCLSYLISGSEMQHEKIRRQIHNELRDAPPEVGYFRNNEQLRGKRLAVIIKLGTEGSSLEVYAAANLLETTIYVFDSRRNEWRRYSVSFPASQQQGGGHQVPWDDTDQGGPIGLYLRISDKGHYEVVQGIVVPDTVNYH